MIREAVSERRCRRYGRLIWLEIDGALEVSKRRSLDHHLLHCARCRAEYEELQFAREQVSLLALPADLPEDFPASLPLSFEEQKKGAARVGRAGMRRYAPYAAAAAIALLLLAGAFALSFRRPASDGWEVARLVGAPVIGERAIGRSDRIEVGERLETDRFSRALIRVGTIGHVEIEPGSRVELLSTDAGNHRLSLLRGRMHASITAPPRLFYIETPSAVAIDYGCAYTLEVDESGASLLEVTAGWVSLRALDESSGGGGRHAARESLAPAGAQCRALPGKGPGTPHFADASAAFRLALDRIDFGDGGRAEVETLLREARKRDSLTLFHLLPRLAGDERALVYDRLVGFVPPPDGIARAEILGEKNVEKLSAVLEAWRERVELVSVGGNPADLPKDTGELRLTGMLNVARHSHSATLLADGRVLIAGGRENDDEVLASSEIYDPRSGEFTLAARLTTKRSGHTATLLGDGRVLLAGGSNLGLLASAEIYDPATGAFRAVGQMSTARLGHRATLLADGRVLITGGYAGGGNKLATAELYDPVAESFTTVGPMQTERVDHTATLLANGMVLIAGGASGPAYRDELIRSAELYDPAKRIFIPTGELNVPRYKHGAALLGDGRVIVLGGTGPRLWEDRQASAEIYDPATGRFTPTGNLKTARFKIRDAVLALPNGRILVAGGGARVEIFDPSTGLFSAVSGGLGTARQYATATLLQSGEVLIVGGYLHGLPDLTADVSAWLYRP